VKSRKKVAMYKLMEVMKLEFTLTGRVLGCLFLGTRLARMKIAGAVKLVCPTLPLC
jgi:hypothetical protein